MTALVDKVVMITGVAKGCGKVLAEASAAIVAAVRYLRSDDARDMTGTMLILDGGYTAQ